MKIAVVQLRASTPDTVSGGRYGCLNNASVSHLKSNHRSALQKAYNSSDIAALGNTEFTESG